MQRGRHDRRVGSASRRPATEPGPGSGGDRLRAAIPPIESAIACVDYHTLGWQPAEKDAWDRASQYLWEARNALELAETLWESPAEKRR